MAGLPQEHCACLALLHDWDFDGILDILVATYDGEIRVFKDTVHI